MFRVIRDFLFGKKPETTNTIWAPPPPPAPVDPLAKVETQNNVNTQLAEQAKQHVGEGKVKAISEPITAEKPAEPETVAETPAKPPRKRKPRTTKPKA